MGEAKIPPITIVFFVIFPTLALACAVAVVASPEPRCWAFFAALVAAWIGLRGSSWFIYKNRDDVIKLEKVADATDSDHGLLDNISEEKTDEVDSEHPQTVYNHVHLYKILQGLMRPSLYTIRIQHASVINMAIILIIRMFAINLFQSHPANLDFGPDNIAFTHKFNSFANLITGVMASFLSYPAVAGIIGRIFTTASGDSLLLKKPNVYALWMCEVISAGLTIIPSILVLAAIATNYSAYSNSPHISKLAEWIVGYLLGTSSGMYFSCIVQRVLLLVGGILNALENHNNNADQAVSYVVEKLAISKPSQISQEEKDEEEDVSYGFGKANEYLGLAVRPAEVGFRLMARLCQLLLALTTIMNAIILGATWHYDLESKASAPIICIFIAIMAFVFGTIAFSTNRAY
jgi:hypothetical protein